MKAMKREVEHYGNHSNVSLSLARQIQNDISSKPSLG